MNWRIRVGTCLLVAAIVPWTASRADEAADRRVVESKSVAVRSLLGVVREKPGSAETVRQAEALLGRAEADAKAQKWTAARAALEEAQSLLAAAAPSSATPGGAAAMPGSGPAAGAQDAAAGDRRVVESKAVAVRSLLGIVKGQPGREATARQAEQLLAEADAAARSQQWSRARDLLEQAQAMLAAAAPPPADSQKATRAAASPDPSAAADRRLVESKVVAVRSLLGVVRGQPGREETVRRAEALLARADADAGAQNWTAARAALEEAQSLLMVALPAPSTRADATARGDLGTGGAQRVYAQRRESVMALRDALQRISAEPGVSAEAPKAALASAARQLDAAERLASEGQFGQAKALLDQAYLVLKLNIEGLRRGKTVVHEKKFATPADEYAYELERHESYVLLVRLLMKWDGVGAPPRFPDQVARAGTLREDAGRLAAAGQHREAVKSMEDATAALTQVLRNLGLPIP